MQISRVTRVSNPRRRASSKRRSNPKRLSLKQKLHFGSARQRTAAKAALRKKRTTPKRATSHRKRTASNPKHRRVVRVTRRKRRARSNPAHLLTIGPLMNPAPRRGVTKRRKRKNMATTKRRRTRRARASNPRRRRKNSVRVTVTRRRRRRSVAANPRRQRRVARANPRHRTRRVNVRRRSSGRRRNPSVFGHSVGAFELAKIVAAGLAGVAITKAVPNMLPAGLIPASPFTGTLVSLAVAIGAGMAVNAIMKGDPMIGYAVGFGGLMQAFTVGLNSFLPQVGGAIGLQGLGNGMGDLVAGRFPVPMNPIMAGVPQIAAPMPMPTGAHGTGVGAIFNPFGRAM